MALALPRQTDRQTDGAEGHSAAHFSAGHKHDPYEAHSGCPWQSQGDTQFTMSTQAPQLPRASTSGGWHSCWPPQPPEKEDKFQIHIVSIWKLALTLATQATQPTGWGSARCIQAGQGGQLVLGLLCLCNCGQGWQQKASMEERDGARISALSTKGWPCSTPVPS